jgi:hypothetical protein
VGFIVGQDLLQLQVILLRFSAVFEKRRFLVEMAVV